MDEKFLAALQRIDAATNGIAVQLRDLAEKVKNGGMSADAEAEVLSGLEAAATKLEGIGTSADNPTGDTGSGASDTGTGSSDAQPGS